MKQEPVACEFYKEGCECVGCEYVREENREPDYSSFYGGSTPQTTMEHVAAAWDAKQGGRR